MEDKSLNTSTIDKESSSIDDFRYQQLVYNLPAAIYTTDANGYIKLYNKAAVELWGRTPEVGKDLWCGSWRIFRTDGSPLPLDQCPMALTLKEGRTFRGAEIVVERPDGMRRNVLANPQAIFDAKGNLIEAFNMLIDVTEQKIAEKAIRESEERFRMVADTAPVMIWMCGKDNQRSFFNKGWLKFTGRTMEEELGNGWIENIHPDDKEHFVQRLNTYLEEEKSFTLEYRLKRFDGTYRWINCSVVPRFSSEGEFEGYIGSCIDIQDKKMIAEALEKEVENKTRDLKNANAELERSNKELEQFAYAASHDMQEPLRKIQTFISFLEEQELSSSNKVYLSKIQNSAKRMSDIISGLLSYSQSTAVNGQFSKIDLNALIENVKADLELMIQQKEAVIFSENLPQIWGIPSQMNQLFFNLINNSLKFSKLDTNPVVTISLNKHNNHLDHVDGCIEIVVKDNGIGFESKYSQRIFNLFQRLNDKYSYGGNGIGLALCKKIVENHNGVIFAESEPDNGASFHIMLPSKLIITNSSANNNAAMANNTKASEG